MAKIIEELKVCTILFELFVLEQNMGMPSQGCRSTENHETILGDVNRRLVEAEARETKVAEERDDLATMNSNLDADHTWMRNFGVRHFFSQIVNAILDAPQNTDAVAAMVNCAREAGYKAGYAECLAQVNVVSVKKFTDKHCALRGIDTEAALSTATEAYDGLIFPPLLKLKNA
ncbi:hypothetical protein HanRHA438_Chr10g0448321 [Helianthus annuus]|uniref:Uncharacterized protein n=1 Tax=Helianthus annuus TaxID=4232 RepID=A0A9K3HWD2_HELAN|nr:hypothetical protein HanXRQr2_Chr10g0436181 [Helianthus annuus]KAJ0513534.1 hypothetical protein HanHA300_Chr10g0358681 [Helianthus annuus]KAJ0529635.1 hypothetical protein HanHA89_Chr10g0380141 [Helianthus annuus]KAJ0879180.1 hypothetical protein HanRHA438_Chr10g0448321 [Helianthus annuus]